MSSHAHRLSARAITSLLRMTWQQWQDDFVPRLGAALAFYSILSLGPLLLLLVSIIALVYGNDAAQGRIMGEISAMVGTDGARAIQEILAAAASKKSSGILATLFGFLMLIISASGLFGQLQEALNSIWKVPPAAGGLRTLIKKRLFSFAVVISTGFILLGMLILSTAISALGNMGVALLPAVELLIGTVNFLVSFAIVSALFALIFKYLPDTLIRWRDVWPGAILTAALFTLGKYGIGLYLAHSALSSAYGAAGSFVVLLIWIYYSAQILFFGAEFTHVYAHHHGSRRHDHGAPHTKK